MVVDPRLVIHFLLVFLYIVKRRERNRERERERDKEENIRRAV